MTEYLEEHFTIKELADKWHMSVPLLRAEFRLEPGVIRFGPDQKTRGRKRTYLSIRVPASVAKRVYRRLTGRDCAA